MRSLVINECEVVLKSNGTKEIIDAFNSVLKKYGVVDLAPDEKSNRPGLTGTACRILSTMTDKQHGGEIIKLKKLELQLDGPSFKLYESYRAYLNDLNEKLVGKDSNDSLNGVINSRYVLVRELLLRMVSTALSDSIRIKTDANIGKIIGEFIEVIITESYLEPSKFDSALTIFTKNDFELYRKKLTGENDHRKWLSYIKDMVQILEALDAPKTAFSLVSEYLNATKLVIKKQIYILLDPDVKKGNLSEQYVSHKLVECENSIFLKCKKSQEIAIVNTNNSVQRFKEMYPCIVSNYKGDRDLLGKLYNCLKETEKLDEIVDYFSCIIKMTGWLFILTGVFNIKGLINELEKHYQMCEILSNQDVPNWSKRTECHAFQRPEKFFERAISELNITIKPEIACFVISVMKTNVEALIKIQKSYGDDEQSYLIHPDALKLIQSQQNSNTNSGLKFVNASPTIETKSSHDELPPLSSHTKPQSLDTPVSISSYISRFDGDKKSVFSRYSIIDHTYNKVANCFIHEEKNQDELKYAAKSGNFDNVQRLIERENTNINGRGLHSSICSIVWRLFDRTPLILASQHGHLEIVNYLISKGAQLNIKDLNGYTALDHAVDARHVEICKKLLEVEMPNREKAELNIKTKDELNSVIKDSIRFVT